MNYYLKGLGLQLICVEYKNFKQYINNGFKIYNKSRSEHYVLFDKENKVNILEWNNYIENFYKFYDIKIHVHCFNCNCCCLSNKKHFNRCGKCKKVYFCSPECKKKNKHLKKCYFFKNINLEKMYIRGIVFKDEDNLLYPMI